MAPFFTGVGKNLAGFGFGRESSGGASGTTVTDEQTYVYSSNTVVSASRPGPSAGKEMQSVRFYVQGAGGGANPTGPGNTDQSGGFTDYTHESNLQDTYKLVIGQGGKPASGGTAWGGGGDGASMPSRSQYGGGGGGGSFVFYSPITSFTASNPYHSSIVVCSGGGGGAFNDSLPSNRGGRGGTSTGEDGQRGTTGGGNGGGGTQVGGGTGGTQYPSSNADAESGNDHQGGSGNQSGYEFAGGGGGGGYYGGGAGGSCLSVCPGPTRNGSGGGGSSFYRSPEGTLNSWSQGIDTSHPKYDAARGSAGEPGKITIVWEWLE